MPSLCFHELLPGHHLHFTTQQLSTRVLAMQNSAFFNAFNEGWAEYSVTLAGELGLYQNAIERFGRLMSDAFLTARLVVDTGMNALGWSLEQARDYMRENSFLPEKEIVTETIRYSCDILGQSLAYKLGDTYMLELREEMKNRLGSQFDIRDFHQAVLHPGALPLPVLKWHVSVTTEAILAGNPNDTVSP